MALKANEVSLRLARGGWGRYGFNNQSGGYWGVKSASKSHRKRQSKRGLKKKACFELKGGHRELQERPGRPNRSQKAPKRAPKIDDFRVRVGNW